MPLRTRITAALAAAWLASASPAALARAAESGRSHRETGWLRDLLRLRAPDAVSSPDPALAFLAARLTEAGVASELLVSPTGSASLLARLPATRPGARAILLLHHVDVVAPGDGWTVPPFSGDLRDGAIWGRGAIDAKSLGVAHLAAMLEAAKLPHRSREILFLATSDEERGGREGAGWLLAAHADRFARVEAVLNEGGANRSVGDRVLYWGVEHVQKRPLWIEVVAKGRGGHASTGDPRSATHTLIEALARVVADPPAMRGSATALDFLARLGELDPRAARAGVEARRLLDGQPLTEAGSKALAGYEPLLRDTVQVTTFDAADQSNVVAAEARATLDMRLLPESDPDAVLSRLRERLGAGVEVRVRERGGNPEASPTDHEIYRVLSRELAREAPVIPLFIPAMTDSRYFRERGIPAYGFSPFVLDARELLTVHARDERISARSFERGVERMKALVRALVTSDAP